MSVNSAPQNVETALQLRARLHEALDAFKQISDTAIDHYIHQQQEVLDASSREPVSGSLEETLSEINKITHVIVKMSWSARLVCENVGAARSSSYAPPRPIEDPLHAAASSAVQPNSVDSLSPVKVDMEVFGSTATHAKAKERAGQVGQLALKFEQEAQQALKHAEESAPKPKLTRTFSYKEKQAAILPSHSSQALSSPSRTASPPRIPVANATKQSPVSSTKPVTPTKKSTAAPTTTTPIKKTSSPPTPPPSAKKVAPKPSSTEEKKRASVAKSSTTSTSKLSGPKPAAPAVSKSPPARGAPSKLPSKPSHPTPSSESPTRSVVTETMTASSLAPPTQAEPDVASSPLADSLTPPEDNSLQPDSGRLSLEEPQRTSTQGPMSAADSPRLPLSAEVDSVSQLPVVSAATPIDPESTFADVGVSLHATPVPTDVKESEPQGAETEALAYESHLSQSERCGDDPAALAVIVDSESQPRHDSVAPSTAEDESSEFGKVEDKKSKKSKKTPSEKLEGERAFRKAPAEKHSEKKKLKPHSKSDDAYSSDSAYNSDSASSSKKKKSSSRPSTTAETSASTPKKKTKRDKVPHDTDSDGREETTAAGFPAVPGLLVSVEDAVDKNDSSVLVVKPSRVTLLDVDDEKTNRRHRFRNRTNTIDEGDLRSAKLQHDVVLEPAIASIETSATRADAELASNLEPDEIEPDRKRTRPTLQRAARSYSALSQSSVAVAQFQESLKAKRASSTAAAEPVNSGQSRENSASTDPSAPSANESATDAARPRQPRRGASQGSGLTTGAAGGPSIGRVLVRQVPRSRGIPLKSSKEAEARLKAEEMERERRLNREKESAAREAAENAEVEAMLSWESEISEGVATKRWEEMQKRKRKTVSLDSKLKSSPTKPQKGKSESRTSLSSSSSTSSSSPSKQARPKKIAFRAAPAILYERNQNPRALKFEEEDSEDNIRFKEFNNETRIASGTVEKLVQRLTYDKLTDTNYLSTFLLTYRSFMAPKELLDILEVRWNTAPPAGTTNIDGWKTNVLYLIRLRISNVLKYWIEKYYDADFEGDAEMLQQLDEFIDKIASSGLDKPAHQVRSMLEMKAEGKEKRSIEFSSATPRPRLGGIVPGKTSAKALGFLDIDPLELSRQLTSTEHRLFKAIAYKELLGTRWTKKDKTKESPHVVEALQFSDRVVDWVATCILSQQDRTKRAQTLCRFIALGKLLVRMNNFNGAFEVLSGLRSLGIMRLKRTWNMLPTVAWTSFEELERLFDPDGNWKRYREALESAAPAVPHLNLFLSELIYVNDKHPDTITHGADTSLINFEKMWLIADIINKIQHYQEISYNILPVSIIEDYLMSCDTISALDQHEVSLAREPEK
eukprot:TRINITY_DN3973_c0_g1_i1.p1 TRINITY_DN3973_c0_g1~~TRINITY_DN3973_c0_g1_i1.p1  ORF type:complete len:1365 (+),score=241.85 TRINITY_DN3973_c0_g1_i1:79-4173(+)